ncbi:putative RNA pseudouridine synthase MG209 homolog [Alishewanella longhuensis]|uniref:RNA pseudouridine synthase MG209 homolog n=1 Tax=Alishewanella longhuensis TaxID=1091037 RepID=A0ABQ3L2W0_9ALTE|nr:RluA family pseudouridine synthase [Alishewanella longhuensis]GHG61274.1 putative RNA pseudouridine synthase MG209 homolog [Alishewanella longhuensis]
MKLSRRLQTSTAVSAIDFLASAVPELSKGRLKDAMSKGAVQLLGKPVKRLRRSQQMLKPGDSLALHYDDDILQRQSEPAVLLHDEKAYSVWFKPAGMLSQGNEWGDHLSLLRFAEQFFTPLRQVFLLHRLDREASGLVMLAHSKQAAAALSKLIAEQQISKIYQIRVKGELSSVLQQQGAISIPLDNKPCESRFTLQAYDATSDSSLLTVQLITGRKHQIRRHFAAIEHPVLGDPQYGKNNKNAAGLALQAIGLSFNCPLRRRRQTFELPASLMLTHC